MGFPTLAASLIVSDNSFLIVLSATKESVTSIT